MTLGAGTRLGPYDILHRLGAGGMGEVYRARDTTLDRDVAIKILPELFAADRDRLARFERDCLERDPKRRLRDIGDARLELEEGSRFADYGDSELEPAKRNLRNPGT